MPIQLPRHGDVLPDDVLARIRDLERELIDVGVAALGVSYPPATIPVVPDTAWHVLVARNNFW